MTEGTFDKYYAEFNYDADKMALFDEMVAVRNFDRRDFEYDEALEIIKDEAYFVLDYPDIESLVEAMVDGHLEFPELDATDSRNVHDEFCAGGYIESMIENIREEALYEINGKFYLIGDNWVCGYDLWEYIPKYWYQGGEL